MKIFLSWSGEESHGVALLLKDWLPLVLPGISGFVSSEDITSGSKWMNTIDDNLQQCDFGIICVTRGNLTSPWLLFEAGALSVAKAKEKVSPFLYGVDPDDIKATPLANFQCAFPNKDSIRKLVMAINNLNGKNSESVELINKRYENLWSILDAQLAKHMLMRRSSLVVHSTITTGLDSIFKTVDKIESLDIFALNTQTIINQLETYKNISIDKARIIMASDDVINWTYSKSEQHLAKETTIAIKQILDGRKTAVDIWDNRFGGVGSSVVLKFVDFFPTKYVVIVNNTSALIGFYHYEKDGIRHGLKLAETFTFDNRTSSMFLNYITNWFNGIWEIAS